MATNDFIYDIVEKLRDENLEFLIVHLQKGKSDHNANAHYNINSEEGAEMIAVTLEAVYEDLGKEFTAFNIADEQDVDDTSFDENKDDEDS